MLPHASALARLALVLSSGFILVATAAVYTPSHTVDPGSGTGTWSLSGSYPPFSIFSSDQIVFRYPANAHTVNLSPAASCSDIGAELDTPGQTSYTFDPMTYNSGALASGGTITFVCSVADHCNLGMIVTVTVTASSSPTPPSPFPTQSPLPNGATHAPSTVSPNVIASQTVILMPSALVAHFSMALIAFCLLLPLGTMMSLTRWEASTGWFARHFYIQIVGGLVGITLIISGPFTQVDLGFTAFAQTHDVLGLCVIIALMMQLSNSILRPHAAKPGEAVSLQRHIWLWVHRVFGAFVLFGGLTNCVLGAARLSAFAGDANQLSLIGSSLTISLTTLQNLILGLAGAAIGVVSLGICFRFAVLMSKSTSTSSKLPTPSSDAPVIANQVILA